MMKSNYGYRNNSFKKYYDSLLKEIKNLNTPTLLSDVTNWFNIGGTVVSIIIALLAINLTVRYGELSRRYGENKDQLIQLDSISLKQQMQIDTLVEILKEIKIENTYTLEQTGILKDQNKLSINESQAIGKQLLISSQEQKRSNDIENLKSKSDFNRFRQTFSYISDLAPYKGSNFFKLYNFQQQKDFINKLIPLLEEEMNNPILLQNDTATLEWINLYKEAKFHLKTLNTPYTDIVVVNDKGAQRDSSLIQNANQLEFGNFVDMYYKFFDYIFFKIIKKGAKDGLL